MTGKQYEQPNLLPESDWVTIGQLDGLDLRPTFVSGGEDTDRLRVQYYHRPRDNRLVGKAWFGPGAQGPPGHAHGGSIAALLDEAMGFACWLADQTVVAAEITIGFKEMLPLGEEMHFEAWVEQIDGKKITAGSKLYHADGTLFSQGSGLFIVIDAEKFRKALGHT